VLDVGAPKSPPSAFEGGDRGGEVGPALGSRVRPGSFSRCVFVSEYVCECVCVWVCMYGCE